MPQAYKELEEYDRQQMKDFISELEGNDIKLWLDGDLLHYEAPKGAMDEDVIKLLKNRKNEIIKYFKHEQGSPAVDNLSVYAQEKQLKVAMQREITTYLHRSLPLCIILAHEKLLPWYRGKFIQIFSHADSSGYVEFNYLEPYDCCNEVADIICMGYNLLKYTPDIIDFIIENINMGYYLIVNVDEYYLCNKNAYNNSHFVHSSLIYGYDSKERNLKGIGFNQDYLFTEMTFSYSRFRQAFENGKLYYKESAPWCEWSCIQLIRAKEFDTEYPFSLNKFTEELGSYIFSIEDRGKMYSFGYHENQVKYGFEVHNVLTENIKNLIKGAFTIDYRAIHLLAEHKKCLYDRLEYIASRYNISEDFKALNSQYSEIVEEFNKLRVRFLVQSSKQPGAGGLSDENKNVFNTIIDGINAVKNQEYIILKDIYEHLKKIQLEIIP